MVNREILTSPKSFFTSIGTSHVYFVANITMDNNLAVLGFSDVKSRRMVFNVAASSASSSLIQSTIHHEIAHLAMYSYYGNMMFANPDWPIAKIAGNRSANISFPGEGYVSNYATTSVAEDMAEVFAYLMTDVLSDELHNSLSNDGVLHKKVHFIKTAVNDISPNFIWPV